VTGHGGTKKAARQNAWQRALEYVVGAHVESTTEVKDSTAYDNPKVEEQILTHRDGYVSRSNLSVPERTENGDWKVTGSVVVKEGSVRETLKEIDGVEVSVSGESLAAQGMTKFDRAEDAQRLFREAMAPFLNGKVLKAGTPRIGEVELTSKNKGELPVTVPVGVDSHNYQTAVDQLQRVFDQIAIESGMLEVGEHDGQRRLEIDRYGQSPAGPSVNGNNIIVYIDLGTRLKYYKIKETHYDPRVLEYLEERPLVGHKVEMVTERGETLRTRVGCMSLAHMGPSDCDEYRGAKSILPVQRTQGNGLVITRFAYPLEMRQGFRTYSKRDLELSYKFPVTEKMLRQIQNDQILFRPSVGAIPSWEDFRGGSSGWAGGDNQAGSGTGNGTSADSEDPPSGKPRFRESGSLGLTIYAGGGGLTAGARFLAGEVGGRIGIGFALGRTTRVDLELDGNFGFSTTTIEPPEGRECEYQAEDGASDSETAECPVAASVAGGVFQTRGSWRPVKSPVVFSSFAGVGFGTILNRQIERSKSGPMYRVGLGIGGKNLVWSLEGTYTNLATAGLPTGYFGARLTFRPF
jgi:hypothetical protein